MLLFPRFSPSLPPALFLTVPAPSLVHLPRVIRMRMKRKGNPGAGSMLDHKAGGQLHSIMAE